MIFEQLAVVAIFFFQNGPNFCRDIFQNHKHCVQIKDIFINKLEIMVSVKTLQSDAIACMEFIS